MIYFVRPKSGGRIKIGTTVRLSERLAALKAEFREELEVLGVAAGSFSREKRVHRKFAHLRLRGEWFEPGDDLLAFIAHKARPWDGTEEAPKTVSVKIDEEVMYLVRQAAPKLRKSVQEYVSDILNNVASADIKEKPIKRKPPKPRQPKQK